MQRLFRSTLPLPRLVQSFTPHRTLHTARITLFTRPNCGLCVQAREVLDRLQGRRGFELREVDIGAAGETTNQGGWRDLYDFDVPVIHISRADAPPETPDTAAGATKLMHRFSEDEVSAAMDRVGIDS